MSVDRNEDLDRLVHDAAARLDIPEAALFRLAHRWWWGRDLGEEELDRFFAGYMFRQATPIWVRHYAREVCRSNEWDTARRRNLGLDRVSFQQAPPHRGQLVISFSAALYALVFVMLLGATDDPQTQIPLEAAERPLSCQGGGPGWVLLEDFAYAFAGRSRPSC